MDVTIPHDELRLQSIHSLPRGSFFWTTHQNPAARQLCMRAAIDGERDTLIVKLSGNDAFTLGRLDAERANDLALPLELEALKVCMDAQSTANPHEPGMLVVAEGTGAYVKVKKVGPSGQDFEWRYVSLNSGLVSAGEPPHSVAFGKWRLINREPGFPDAVLAEVGA
jgi:hypothetical protein